MSLAPPCLTPGSYVTMFRNKTYLGIRTCRELEIEDAHEPLVSHEVRGLLQQSPGPGQAKRPA